MTGRNSFGALRHLTPEETNFLRAIIRFGEGGNEILCRLENVVVQDMNDGGMGSLYFRSEREAERKLGRCLVEVEFLDHDGIPVSAAVNLDDQDELFELDIWKVDFSRLLGFPNAQDIVVKSHQK